MGARRTPRGDVTESPLTLAKRLPRPVRATELRAGEPLGRIETRLTLDTRAPRSARLLEAVDA